MFLKLPNLHILKKQKSPSLSRRIALKNFGKLWIVFKGLPLNQRYTSICYTSFVQQPTGGVFCIWLSFFFRKLFQNSFLEDSGISLTAFLSKPNLKLHNISVTPKMVKKVIMNLDSSKASGSYAIPGVVLKNC